MTFCKIVLYLKCDSS